MKRTRFGVLGIMDGSPSGDAGCMHSLPSRTVRVLPEYLAPGPAGA